MKKFILMLVIAFTTVFNVNAQIATQNAKLLDNTFVSVNAGVATPLDFDAVFPLNSGAGITVGKWFSPIWGAEIEGTAWFGSHVFGGSSARFDGTVHNAIRGSYVGLNGLVNLTNLFLDYSGTPRTFELSTVVGTGWLHTYRPSNQGGDLNDLGVKTGLDFAFNLGKTKVHTVSVRPSVLWNISTPCHSGSRLTFNKHNAQLYVGVAYTYHFKTSNGTHHFKTYDVGQMTSEINRLNEELAKKPTKVVVEKIVTKEVRSTVSNTTYVFFAFNNANLDNRAKEELDKLDVTATYVVDAYASNEGSTTYNQVLSQRRADAVKSYLESKGIKVESSTGHGSEFGATTGRIATIVVK